MIFLFYECWAKMKIQRWFWRKTLEPTRIKILDKTKVIKNGKWDQVNKEKQIISKLYHPFFVKLEYSFKDDKRLFFVLSYAANGELEWYIQHYHCLSKECVQFYTAELVLALEYLSECDLVHRDLKPANILLSEEMHVQISDFGAAKSTVQESPLNVSPAHDQLENAFVGTAEYVPPEVLIGKASSSSSDLWSLGCIIYQMMVGSTPFYDPNEYHIFHKIIECDYQVPSAMDNDAKDLISKLLVVDSNKRLGSKNLGGFHALKGHPFFANINWKNLPNEMPPAMKSCVSQTLQSNEEIEGNIFSHDNLNEKLPSSAPDDDEGFGLSMNMPKEEKQKFLSTQKTSIWNHFAKGSLIIKQGELHKKRGLSVKLRQFLLMHGPRLVYVDPETMEEKGEIPWSQDLTVEVKTFKDFNVHVPGRSYQLQDRKGNATKWCKKIDEVKHFYFGKPAFSSLSTFDDIKKKE
ncbi:3-phosphoinositide-dependent protein kinase 1-like isoform X2 [Clavelina lepadiformis]|uniref:3-phosphoinositide-dependent protein kinase 1-like isoform X2 n=1 Tax=Clavelina lepadiformis TaxID=159417 RepID=UPI00404175A9